MRKLLYAVAGAAALSTASLANAAIVIGDTSGSDIVVGLPDNGTMPETVKFDTTTNTAGTLNPWFEFTNDLAGVYAFSVTASTGLLNGSTITLEELTQDGAFTPVTTMTGTGITLDLLTPILQADTTYRFTYQFNAGQGGGTASGNASAITTTTT